MKSNVRIWYDKIDDAIKMKIALLSVYNTLVEDIVEHVDGSFSFTVPSAVAVASMSFLKHYHRDRFKGGQAEPCAASPRVDGKRRESPRRRRLPPSRVP